MGFNLSEHRENIVTKINSMNPLASQDLETMFIRDLKRLFAEKFNLGFFPSQNRNILIDIDADYSKATDWGFFKVTTSRVDQEVLDNMRYCCECLCFRSGKYVKGEVKPEFYSDILYKTKLFVPVFSRKLDESDFSYDSTCKGKEILCFDKNTFSDFLSYSLLEANYFICREESTKRFVPIESVSTTLNSFYKKDVPQNILEDLKSYTINPNGQQKRISDKVKDSFSCSGYIGEYQ